MMADNNTRSTTAKGGFCWVNEGAIGMYENFTVCKLHDPVMHLKDAIMLCVVPESNIQGEVIIGCIMNRVFTLTMW